MNESQERQIAAAQELSRLEGMSKSPWVLFYIIDRIGEYHLTVDTKEEFEKDIYYDVEFLGYTLRTDDSSEWSSAKILTRAGWDAPSKRLMDWLIDLWVRTGKGFKEKFKELTDIVSGLLTAIERNLRDGNHELAYNLAIILLQKIDNEAYLKAMQPLIEAA